MGLCMKIILKGLVFLVSLAGIGYFAYQLYKKWAVTPDITVNVKNPPEYEIPFPAITICSPVFAKHQMANYNEYMRTIAHLEPVNLSAVQQNYLAANTHWCAPNVGGYILEKCPNRTETNIVKLLGESSLTSDELFVSCYLRNYMVECQKIFTRVLTDHGLCYTFNMKGFNTIFNEDQISDEFGSYKDIRISEIVDLDNGYMNFATRPGKVNTATVYMQLNATEASNYCVPFGRIYKVIFHLPNEIPTPFHKAHYISYDHRKVITLSSVSIRSDPSMQNYPPDKRRCYFTDERKLRFFASYSKAHCDFECFANYTLNRCGCVKFSMPRANDTPVCDLDNAHCYFFATNEWTEIGDEENKKKTPCDCLPTCDDIKYNVKLDDVDVAFDDINDLAGFKFHEGALRSRISFQFLDYVGEERLSIAGKKFEDFVDEYGAPIAIVIVCTFLPIINSIIDRFTKEDDEEGGDSGGGGMGDVEKAISPDQLKQDLKAELGDVVGEDTMKTIEQIQADKQLAEDLKGQVDGRVAETKDLMDTFREVKQEIPTEAIAVGKIAQSAVSNLPPPPPPLRSSSILPAEHSEEFMNTLQEINRDIQDVSLKLASNDSFSRADDDDGDLNEDSLENFKEKEAK